MNKNRFLLLLFVLSSIQKLHTQEVVDREFCYIGAGIVYSHADNALGFAAKFAFPMQKGFYFVSQATFLPQMLGYEYKEFRYEIYFELVPIKIRKFQFFAHTGFDWGYWKRGFGGQYLQKMDKYFKDESLLFGGGVNYNIKGIQIYADYKYYPTILSYHSSIGIKVKIFENKNRRQSYFINQKRKKDISPALKL